MFHPTLPCMRGLTLIRYQVVQVREPRQKRLLTATWMVQPFHRGPLPLDSVMGLSNTVLVTGICGSASTASQPAFFS